MRTLDLTDFKSRFHTFRDIDYRTYPHCFGEFWKWKLRTETGSEHILDAEHLKEAHNRLSETLKIWQWHRPFKFLELSKRLREALENIREAYNEIRHHTLLELNDISDEPLKSIWHELGCLKKAEGKNPYGYYLVMATTKPLMFLWGQTLAFDSVVRRGIPQFNIRGLSSDYWSFNTWKEVMLKFQNSLRRQPKDVSMFKEMSRNEYGNDDMVAYGQFLDLYYWVPHFE